jgi:hypothetical protein
MLWGGRFTGGLDPLMVAYNESIYFGRAIYSQDIRGSIAYPRGKFEIKPGVGLARSSVRAWQGSYIRAGVVMIKSALA